MYSIQYECESAEEAASVLAAAHRWWLLTEKSALFYITESLEHTEAHPYTDTGNNTHVCVELFHTGWRRHKQKKKKKKKKKMTWMVTLREVIEAECVCVNMWVRCVAVPPGFTRIHTAVSWLRWSVCVRVCVLCLKVTLLLSLAVIGYKHGTLKLWAGCAFCWYENLNPKSLYHSLPVHNSEMLLWMYCDVN